MRYPKFVNNDSKIIFVAPSFGCTTEPYLSGLENSVNKLKELGYDITKGPNCNSQINDLSNEPSLVAKEFMEAYKDYDFLVSCGGGETQVTTLPFIDFEKLKKEEPKWHMGFSDNTNYLFLLTTICDVATIYGPCAPKLCDLEKSQEVKDAWELVTGEKNVVESYDTFPRTKKTWFGRRKTIIRKNHMIASAEELNFTGRIIGGCMDVLKTFCGTKYDKVEEFNEKYSKDGIIWYLENCDGNPVEIKRELFQLKESGWFKNVKGFIIGKPASAFEKESFGITHITACDILKEFNVPIILDASLGHIHPSMPIINGALAEVNYKNNKLTIEYKFE